MHNLRIALLVAFLISTACILSAASVSTCGITKYGVPGDSFTLTGPTATGGATYGYYWTLDPSLSFTPNAQSQSITFTVPTTSSPSSITASVLVTDTRTGGCALSSCVNLVINTSNTCSLIGTSSMATQICQTKSDPQTYQYTGTADLTKNNLAYLKWLVDGNVINSRDTTGLFSYVWSTSPYNSVGTHTVGVAVYSAKSNLLLSGPCTINVILLPPPATTITPA